jgi:hypothetical protein
MNSRLVCAFRLCFLALLRLLHCCLRVHTTTLLRCTALHITATIPALLFSDKTARYAPAAVTTTRAASAAVRIQHGAQWVNQRALGRMA